MIRNVATGHVYVGSSVDVAGRCRGHFRLLTTGRHHNARLQRAFDHYESAAFHWETAEIVRTEDNLTDREAWWIKHMHATNCICGYNFQIHAPRAMTASPNLDGKRLRHARTARGLRQQDLADPAGTTEATVNRLEQDLQRARLSTIRKLASALEIDPAALMEDDGLADSDTTSRR